MIMPHGVVRLEMQGTETWPQALVAEFYKCSLYDTPTLFLEQQNHCIEMWQLYLQGLVLQYRGPQSTVKESYNSCISTIV
jgi:hypothetical protein